MFKETKRVLIRSCTSEDRQYNEGKKRTNNDLQNKLKDRATRTPPKTGRAIPAPHVTPKICCLLVQFVFLKKQYENHKYLAWNHPVIN